MSKAKRETAASLDVYFRWPIGAIVAHRAAVATARASGIFPETLAITSRVLVQNAAAGGEAFGVQAFYRVRQVSLDQEMYADTIQVNECELMDYPDTLAK